MSFLEVITAFGYLAQASRQIRSSYER